MNCNFKKFFGIFLILSIASVAPTTWLTFFDNMSSHPVTIEATHIPSPDDAKAIKQAFDHHYHAPLVIAPGTQTTLKLAIPKKELNTPLKVSTVLGEYALEDDNNHIVIISNSFPDHITTLPFINNWNTIGITITSGDTLQARFIAS